MDTNQREKVRKAAESYLFQHPEIREKEVFIRLALNVGCERNSVMTRQQARARVRRIIKEDHKAAKMEVRLDALQKRHQRTQ